MLRSLRNEGILHHTVKLPADKSKTDSPEEERTINQVTLLGRVGANPEKHGTPENPVINFIVATNCEEKFGPDDDVHKFDLHRVSLGKPAELRDLVYKFLKKGDKVYVAGKLTHDEIKIDNGQFRTVTAIIADDVIFFYNAAPEK